MTAAPMTRRYLVQLWRRVYTPLVKTFLWGITGSAYLVIIELVRVHYGEGTCALSTILSLATFWLIYGMLKLRERLAAKRENAARLEASAQSYATAKDALDYLGADTLRFLQKLAREYGTKWACVNELLPEKVDSSILLMLYANDYVEVNPGNERTLVRLYPSTLELLQAGQYL